MKLSTHIGHCIQMLAKFGDKDVEIVHLEDRPNATYDHQPRITKVSGRTRKDDRTLGIACYEISRAIKGQFK